MLEKLAAHKKALAARDKQHEAVLQTLEDEVLKTMSTEEEMTVKKLLRVMQVHTMTEDCKSEFIAVVKRVCVVSADIVAEGPFKDQKIIKIRNSKTRNECQGEEQLSMECTVCMEKRITHAFVPCFHMCVCALCAEAIMQTCCECPFCRRQAVEVQHIFVCHT